ncbi:hypothetical protein [Paenibacillus sp. FSL M7-0896]|uniref:hypothetical protein n=1 Tax=unclassified Paenibacillus TaxID=185978 RepID=UPI0030DD4D31
MVDMQEGSASFHSGPNILIQVRLEISIRVWDLLCLFELLEENLLAAFIFVNTGGYVYVFD